LSKEAIKIEQVMTTFSSHLEQRYGSPEGFMEEIGKLLRDKKEKFGSSGYREALEKNLVFLYFFVEELKSLMEIMLNSVNDDIEFLKTDPGLTIMDMEKQLREQTDRKHSEIFGEGSEPFLEEPAGGHGDSTFMQRLEFHYSYLMAARSFSIDFINILYAAQREYRIENASLEPVWSYIDMSANYYIGNIAVGEKQTEE
jgi:hypothetical protein